MHFAMGMGGAGAAALGVCTITRRGWRLVPAAMTFGGIWAVAPDLPRLFREDFPSLPFATLLGDRNVEKTLHAFGDLFFFHARLDAAPHEYALHGLVLILLFYNAAIAGLLWLERRRWKAVPPIPDAPRPRRRPRRRRGTTADAEPRDE